ncbi:MULTISPECIES: DNA methyltransferase [Actinomycetes]|uniref:DNA methyltransferase n=1 Tax=Actinomycetes TaxID=1760 RepID=UPI0018F86893|nr:MULTISPECIES: DNA methyltransferase [Actinomycetes]
MGAWTARSRRSRSRTTRGAGHPAVGTVEIARRCVRLGCWPGGTVLDPFSGSGTTGLAAREHRCRFIGIDLDPDSHRVAVRRLGLGEEQA